MPDATITYLLGLAVGFIGGLAAAWRWRPPVKVELKVDQAYVDSINAALILSWLDSRGLVWMPKGMETIVEGKTR